MIKKKLRRLWKQATADKKKFGLMVLTLAVGLLLWGRLILLEKVPRVATADPTPGPAENASDQPRAPEHPPLPPLDEVAVDLPEALTLNLFAFRQDRYKLSPPENSGEMGIESGNEQADELERRRVLVQEARTLRLQSVIQGARPAIVVNGRVLRVGDSINGFEIASFDQRSAKVTRDGLTFTLTMSSD